ncbi:unnamed protein product [Candidula unifasciata]|uniref:SAP domain-containing protein n=1 Tax=Candidula unifasciata TaxID=100452 RepID=A0A8S3ZRA0_9EUPU|nr:unnamed protein product [Candidula unifasciata]
MENSEAGDSTDNSLSTSLGLSLPTPTSPPDQASICMDKNRESLKRKLMLRRSVTELLFSFLFALLLKTPPAFADKMSLCLVTTGDLLRHKIQQRPNRQLLVQQHILEDTNIDPSLHERQRLLKRSRLLDDLNDKLSHRPGPLELVQENILQPSLELVNAIRDGSVQFMSTSDTEDMDQSGPSFTFVDGSGSGGIQCPSFDESSALYVVSSPSPVPHDECLPVSSTSANNITVPATVCPQIPFIVSTMSPPGSAAEVLSNHPGTSSIAFISLDNNNNSSSNNNNSGSKSRIKKPKPKVVPKSRIIKFHEYKGPPSAVKNQPSNTPASSSSNSDGDTPYNIMLQQQQLFLQLQLQFQQMQQQQSSTLVPGAQTDQNLASSGMKSVVVMSPPVTQPILAGNTALVQTISFHEPQIYDTNLDPQPIISKIAVSPMTTAQTSTGQILNAQTVSTSQASLILPQTRPTQSAPRQTAKALTSIPAGALSVPKLTGNLEEMKVADLKAELKKRSLPVSGSKPQLIERLKPFTDSSSSMPSSPVSIIPKSDSRPSSRMSTPLQFSQAPVASAPSNSYANVVSITQSNTSAPAASFVNTSSQNSSSRSAPSFSLLSRATKQDRTIVSVKPFIKDELVTSTTISLPSSPQTLMTTNSGTVKTIISPVHKVSSAPALLKPAVPSSKNLRFADATQKTFPYGEQDSVSETLNPQALASVTTETSQPTSAGMMQMEVTSSASVLQLQQLQQLHMLQHLQQQLMQQTQTQQQQFPHQIFQEQSPSSSVQLTESDHMVLAQAKQIEELQRQLQESHQRLELNQQHHEQQLMQVHMPSDFAQQQQQQPSPVMQHQREPVSLGFNDPSGQPPPTVLSGPSTSKSQRSDDQAMVFTDLPTTDAPPDYKSGIVSRTTSVPPSSLDTNQQKLNIHRCSSAPYISGQLKEPPYYHEAIRQKQQQMGNMKNSTTSLHSPTSCLNLQQVAPDCKSQAMDDVLEILIRHGELPPNAATEAFPSSEQTRVRTLPQTSAATTFISSPPSLPKSSSKTPVSVTMSNDQTSSYPSSGSPVTSTTRSMTSQQHNQPSTSRIDSSNPILTLEHPDIFNTALLNDTQFSSSKIHGDAAPSSPLMNEDTSSSVFGEFPDWGDMIPSADLSAMDFSVEFGFDQLYLGDPDRSLDTNICQDNQFSQEQTTSRLDTSSGLNTTHLNNAPHSHSDNSSTTNMYMHGLEPHSSLDQHGHCNETLTASNQMDTSEWLDALMPDSNVNRMNTELANKPSSASFTTNSYMIPHFQQERFDNYSDSGVIQSPVGWEQLINPGTGS